MIFIDLYLSLEQKSMILEKTLMCDYILFTSAVLNLTNHNSRDTVHNFKSVFSYNFPCHH